MRALSILLPLAVIGCAETGVREHLPPVPHHDALPISVERVTDTHVQVKPMKADILFVISNWWSSARAQEELIDAFDDMLYILIDSGIDYHIGVISTDTDHIEDNGKLREGLGVRWIDTENTRPILTFTQMATMEASGCVGPRRPRDATFMALERQINSHNAGFRRNDATIHTVFVSDEADMSHDHSVNEWIEWYDSYGPNPDRDTLSAIVDLGKAPENVTAAEFMGGAAHDIFDVPWDNVLQHIGLQARGPQSEFFLSRVPEKTSIEVWVYEPTGLVQYVQGPRGEGDFKYIPHRNSILFHDYMPPAGAQIDITYEPI